MSDVVLQMSASQSWSRSGCRRVWRESLAAARSMGDENARRGSVPKAPSLQVREIAEDLEARVNLFARQVLQATGTEVFHGERSHDAAVEHAALQHVARNCFSGSAGCRDGADEAAGK